MSITTLKPMNMSKAHRIAVLPTSEKHLSAVAAQAIYASQTGFS